MRASFVSSATVLFAALVLAGCSKPSTPSTPPPGPPPTPGTTATPPSPPPIPPSGQPAAATGDAAVGKTVYMKNCAACHGLEGHGKRPGQPDLTNAAWQKKMTDQQIAQVIRDGHGSMPAFGKKLSDKERADVLAYIRTLATK